jgi:hypothetical protein
MLRLGDFSRLSRVSVKAPLYFSAHPPVILMANKLTATVTVCYTFNSRDRHKTGPHQRERYD